jgi:biotin transport system substrate-specific component
MVAAALVCAVMVVVGPLAINAGPVPITLQIFPVVLAALLLSSGWAAGAMALYLAIGALGVPVYAHGTGGLGVLFGPTGGYLFGFVAGAWLGALVRGVLARRISTLLADASAATVAVAGTYALGWAWLAFGPTHLSAIPAFVGGVAPFLIPDAIKGAIAILIAKGIRRARGVAGV